MVFRTGINIFSGCLLLQYTFNILLSPKFDRSKGYFYNIIDFHSQRGKLLKLFGLISINMVLLFVNYTWLDCFIFQKHYASIPEKEFNEFYNSLMHKKFHSVQDKKDTVFKFEF